MATRRITEQEINQINKILGPRFGTALQVSSGTYEKNGDVSRYHLVIGQPVNPPTSQNLQRMGKILKKEWDSTAEYYSFGEKMA